MNEAKMTSPHAVNFALSSPRVSTATRPQRTPASTTPNTTYRSRMSAFSPVGPVLTPAPSRTPRGSQGLLLLSPSRTLTESLSALASSTAHQLEEVWDEVGYTPQDRAAQLSDLLVQLRDMCQAKVSEEEGVAETFRQTIIEAKEELKATSEALKAPIDPQLIQEGGHHTLTDELATLESALDILREEAEIARKDLAECRDFLRESHEALGLEMDPCWDDIETDLTASRREQFRVKADEIKEELSTRTAAIVQLLRDCQHLMNDLAIDGHTGTQLERKIAGSLVRSKDNSFMMASKFETDTCIGISSNALEELSKHVAGLSKEKRRRKNRLQEMGAEIAMLWEQLRISEEEQQAFTESVKGLGMDTIEKGELELRRLQSLKSKMLISLVDEARETIRGLWEDTNATAEVRNNFRAMDITEEDGLDDEILDLHEEYIRLLQERLEQMKPIIRLIERREDIIRERAEYEELQKDSDRLQQRGAAMAKQLMEEEKMARRIKKELPKLTRFLEEKLNEWKESHGESFQFNGQPYAETMRRQDEEWAHYKTAAIEHKLKKKQEKGEPGAEENNNNHVRGISNHAPGGRRKGSTRPLGDSREANKRSTSRARSRDGGDVSKLGQRSHNHASRQSGHI